MGGAATTLSINQQIAKVLGTVPEVESVYIFSGEAPESFRVMTIVDQEDDRVYELIYDRELQLAREMPAAQFDFSVLARRGRAIEQIAGLNQAAWERSPLDGNPERAY